MESLAKGEQLVNVVYGNGDDKDGEGQVSMLWSFPLLTEFLFMFLFEGVKPMRTHLWFFLLFLHGQAGLSGHWLEDGCDDM